MAITRIPIRSRRIFLWTLSTALIVCFFIVPGDVQSNILLQDVVGHDHLGRNILSRSSIAAFNSLFISAFSACLLTTATLLAVYAEYVTKSSLISRLGTAVSNVPVFIYILLILSITSKDAWWIVLTVYACTGWANPFFDNARAIHGTLEKDHVKFALGNGEQNGYVFWKHVVIGSGASKSIYLSFFGESIFLFGALSILGFGDSAKVDLGHLIFEYSQFDYAWALVPLVFSVVIVLVAIGLIHNVKVRVGNE